MINAYNELISPANTISAKRILVQDATDESIFDDVSAAISGVLPEKIISNPSRADVKSGLNRVYLYNIPSLGEKGENYMKTVSSDPASPPSPKSILGGIDPYTFDLYTRLKNSPCVEEVGFIPDVSSIYNIK